MSWGKTMPMIIIGVCLDQVFLIGGYQIQFLNERQWWSFHVREWVWLALEILADSWLDHGSDSDN